MSTSTSLLEKQKTQLNLILNWTQQLDEQQADHCLIASTHSPDLSAFDSDSSSSVSLLDCHLNKNNNNNSRAISLSPSLSVEFNNNSTYFDSLNDILINKVL